MGHAPDYVRHVYKVERELKSYTIYSFVEVSRSKNLLTDLIRIEPYRDKSNTTGINDYLRLRDAPNWTKCSLVTGLRKVKDQGIFYGDCRTPNLIGNKSKSLLMFRFSPCGLRLFIYVFRDFYPFNKGFLPNIANSLK
jgi:hypothetical protein